MTVPLTLEVLSRLDALERAATLGPWDRYGQSIDPHGNPCRPVPTQGSLEAAPGLSIGSLHHTEPIARFSGYLMNVEANADLVTLLRTHARALLDAAGGHREDCHCDCHATAGYRRVALTREEPS